MKLYEIWKNMAGQLNSREEYDRFWNTYFSMETENYRKLLSDPARIYSGTEKDLAAEFGMDQATFCGFIDGINTSLRTAVDLETLEEDTPVTLDVDYEKLYYNMRLAKAPWLYELPEWGSVLSEEKRKEITKQFREDHIFRAEKKVGRNDPCPCGSGKKYKNCCGKQ